MDIDFVRQEDMELVKEKNREIGIKKMKNTIANRACEDADSKKVFGEVTERRLLTLFKDIVMVERPKLFTSIFPVDWIYHIDQKEVKIKQVSSSILYKTNYDGKGHNRETFEWNIRRNDIPDIFILSAWQSIERVYYVWAIGSYEIVNGREFWNREKFVIALNKSSLDKYDKFSICKNGLENIQNSLEKRFYEIQKNK